MGNKQQNGNGIVETEQGQRFDFLSKSAGFVSLTHLFVIILGILLCY